MFCCGWVETDVMHIPKDDYAGTDPADTLYMTW